MALNFDGSHASLPINWTFLTSFPSIFLSNKLIEKISNLETNNNNLTKINKQQIIAINDNKAKVAELTKQLEILQKQYNNTINKISKKH